MFWICFQKLAGVVSGQDREEIREDDGYFEDEAEQFLRSCIDQ